MRAVVVGSFFLLGATFFGALLAGFANAANTLPNWWPILGLIGAFFTISAILIAIPSLWWQAFKLFITEFQPISLWFASPKWKHALELRLSKIEYDITRLESITKPIGTSGADVNQWKSGLEKNLSDLQTGLKALEDRRPEI
jgi:hypothetical protein